MLLCAFNWHNTAVGVQQKEIWWGLMGSLHIWSSSCRQSSVTHMQEHMACVHCLCNKVHCIWITILYGTWVFIVSNYLYLSMSSSKDSADISKNNISWWRPNGDEEGTCYFTTFIYFWDSHAATEYFNSHRQIPE